MCYLKMSKLIHISQQEMRLPQTVAKTNNKPMMARARPAITSPAAISILPPRNHHAYLFRPAE